MKEKYIFFTLLAIALIMLVGARAGKEAGDKISAELTIEKKLKRIAQKKLVLSEKINMDEIKNSVVFSHYEKILKRSPFFKVQAKHARAVNGKIAMLALEEKAPRFIYRGKIISGNRLVVIIEQTRSGEMFMVSRGENVDGYKVFDITDKEVVLSKKGQENIVLETIESLEK